MVVKRAKSVWQSKGVGIVAALVLAGLLGGTLWYLLRESRLIIDTVIADEIPELVEIFRKIDNQCTILEFEHEKNHIDFLNVVKFVGSEVGSMNLMYPKNWQGPYKKDNPTIQEKLYQIINTTKGYFIAPGDGVKLTSGKVIGIDIILDKNADIPALLADGTLLKGARPMAAQLVLTKPLMQLGEVLGEI